MPHVVIQGPIDLTAYARDFEPIRMLHGSDVLRADTLYLDRSGRTVLIEALAVEGRRKLPFYIKISAHEGRRATVRIDPQTHPERSEGVKRIVAAVGADLLARTPGSRLERTNLVLPSGHTDPPGADPPTPAPEAPGPVNGSGRAGGAREQGEER